MTRKIEYDEWPELRAVQEAAQGGLLQSITHKARRKRTVLKLAIMFKRSIASEDRAARLGESALKKLGRQFAG